MSQGSSGYSKIEGELSAAGLRFAIVVSRFNSFITDRLLAGAIDAISRSGGDASTVNRIRSRISGNPHDRQGSG